MGQLTRKKWWLPHSILSACPSLTLETTGFPLTKQRAPPSGSMFNQPPSTTSRQCWGWMPSPESWMSASLSAPTSVRSWMTIVGNKNLSNIKRQTEKTLNFCFYDNKHIKKMCEKIYCKNFQWITIHIFTTKIRLLHKTIQNNCTGTVLRTLCLKKNNLKVTLKTWK